MAPPKLGQSRNVNRTSSIVNRIVEPAGGGEADEAMLLNGLAILGYDIGLLQGFSDRDPNRRFANDAVVRAFRAGVSQADIEKAIKLGAYLSGRDIERNFEAVQSLSPEQREAARQAETQRPFAFKGEIPVAPPGAPAPAAPAPGAPSPGAPAPAPRVLPGDVRAAERPTPSGGGPRTPRDVMELQRQLNTKGAGLKVDGIYGPKTQAAERRLGGGALAGVGGGESVSGTLGQALGGGGGGAGGGGGGALTPLLDPKASDAEVEAYIRKTYGFSAWALEEPDVRGAVRDVARQLRGAVVDEATMDSMLEARLLNTDWWKTRTANQRLRIQQRHEDPAEFNRGIETEFRNMQGLVNRIGFAVPEGRLREIARQSYEFGWEDTERRRALSAEFDYSPETGAQTTAKITTDLRDRASAYLVNLSEQTIDNWGRQMVAGDMPQDAFDGYLREQAKSLFPVFAAQIDQGLATRDLVEPYAERLGKLLEIDPTSIDFTQPKFMKFLQQRDEKGQIVQPMLYEVDKMARSDPNLGWDRTKNAREEAADLSRRILQSFGRTA